MRPRPPLVERVYRASLALYPRAFRDRFGDEIRDFARLRIDAARRRGTAASARETVGLFEFRVRCGDVSQGSQFERLGESLLDG